MPANVPTVLLKGLAEGLTLRAAERGPVGAEGLVDRFEDLLGKRPHPNQVESVLRELDQADLVRRPDTDSDEGYRLTQDGARRLEAYRRLPGAFKVDLVELFRIDPTLASQPQSSRGDAGSPRRGDGGSGWVREVLDRIPEGIEVRARYARVSLDRDPAARSWTLRVERHEPGRYEGAGACPLTFLYEAATKLVADARAPPSPSRDVRPVAQADPQPP